MSILRFFSDCHVTGKWLRHTGQTTGNQPSSKPGENAFFLPGNFQKRVPPGAYETLLEDVMAGDATLFMRG